MKPLKRVKNRELYYLDQNGNTIKGFHGNLRGDCTELSGDCSGLSGNCTELSGDLNEIKKKMRMLNNDIQSYVEEDKGEK